MSISQAEAADFGPVNTLADSVSEDHSQQMDLWSSQVLKSNEDLAKELNGQMTQVQAAAQDVQGATENLSVQAEKTVSSAQQFQDMPHQLESGMQDTQIQAVQSGQDARNEADSAQLALETTSADAATIGQGLSEEVQSLSLSLEPGFSEMKSSADQANASQVAVLAELQRGGEEMNQSISKTKTQADDLTAQAQAAVDDANSNVKTVAAEVAVVRQDVVEADTIVDQEVVKRGGESKMLATNPHSAIDSAQLQAASDQSQPSNASTADSADGADGTAVEKSADAGELASEKEADALTESTPSERAQDPDKLQTQPTASEDRISPVQAETAMEEKADLPKEEDATEAVTAKNAKPAEALDGLRANEPKPPFWNGNAVDGEREKATTQEQAGAHGRGHGDGDRGEKRV